MSIAFFDANTLRQTGLFQPDVHLLAMKIHFFGAARTTTGSMYLIEINGKKLLLECGLFQGHREEANNRNCCFPFDPKQIDAVVLSHAHMDHRVICRTSSSKVYAGNIHCTFATRDLCSIMLVDSAHIQMEDAAFVSKQRAKSICRPSNRFTRSPMRKKRCGNLFPSITSVRSCRGWRDCDVSRCRTHSRFGAGDFGF